MDFSLDEQQRRTKETVREFLEDEGGIELARRQIEGEDVVDEVWRGLADLDYTALTVSKDYGGLGEGAVYLALLAEELGRYAAPGPVLETLGFGAPLVAELGTGEQRERVLPAVADGDVRLSFALHDDASVTPPETVEMEVEIDDGAYVLDGTKTLVPYAEHVDALVVATRTRDESGYAGISLFVVDAGDVDAMPLEPLDGTRPIYDVDLDGLEVGDDALLGGLHAGGDALRRALDVVHVGASAALVGGASEAVERSTAHANEREQFGQPVGRFQAVKHRIVDMWMETQGARSLVYYAAWALENDSADAPRAVSHAASFAAEECTRAFGDDVLNHGGMGFTWDHDAHVYLKQARTWETLLSTPEEHRERVAASRL